MVQLNFSVEKQRDIILTNLFKSKKLHVEVLRICAKNKIHKDTYISEDIISETFYYLARTSADKIIEIEKQGNLNLLRYAVVIGNYNYTNFRN